MKSRGKTVSCQIVLEAFEKLGVLRVRGVLSVAGIAVGTAAVIAMLHVGHSARSAALEQFATLGTDLLMIEPRSSSGHPPVLPIRAVRALTEDAMGIDVATAIIQSGGSIRVGRESIPVTVLAATQAIYDLGKAELVTGRFTYDLDRFAPFAVLGAGVATDLASARGRATTVGDAITVDGQTLTVIGILADAPTNMILAVEFNRSVIVPFEAARRVAPGREITNVGARLSFEANDIEVVAAIENFLNPLMPTGAVSARSARQIIANVEQQMRIYRVLLLAIGTVSLAVGGMGIMNMMLMSVMERRQEIGLRLALGARKSDIHLMFLTETLAVSLAGSALGIVFGQAAGWVFADFSGWRFEASPFAVPLGIGMAFVVGLFFGIYPAMRAAKLDPIVALRGS